MAKPKKSKSGIWILNVCFGRRRITITLGKTALALANLFAANLDLLISHRKHQPAEPIPASIQIWLESLSDRHKEQLGEVGLVDASNFSLTVDDLITLFLKEYNQRDDVAPSTKRQFKTCMRRFPPSLKTKLISEVSPKKKHYRNNAKPVFGNETKKQMIAVVSWQREHYALSSWSRANGRLREIGVWAVANGICDYNPFSLLPVPDQTNDERNTHVEAGWILDAMSQCTHPDTRLLFALGRFAGCRLLSEARTLKPDHIDWENSTLRVFDSKKLKFRSMPLFDEIREELERHGKEVAWGRYVLSDWTLGKTDANATKHMKKAVQRTEHQQWEKVTQNLRSSCENELLNAGFDERLVTKWMGHTIKVSRKHYQNETNADRARAVKTLANKK